MGELLFNVRGGHIRRRFYAAEPVRCGEKVCGLYSTMTGTYLCWPNSESISGDVTRYTLANDIVGGDVLRVYMDEGNAITMAKVQY